jgi:RNA 3'-terminal phosphate cyclase-like protein
MEKVTNGSSIEISYTGTAILYKPGVIVGGSISHDCGSSKSINYFLEFLLVLAPFSKNAFDLKLQGITNDSVDISIDAIRTVSLPLMRRFGIDGELELKIVKRGYAPLAGGEVNFKCPIVKQLKPVRIVEEGRIRRIRGISHSSRVSPQMSNRLIESCRSVINRYIPDIYIYSDVYKGSESGK